MLHKLLYENIKKNYPFQQISMSRGVLGIKFWFMVFIFLAFAISMAMITRMLDFGKAVNTGAELSRIKAQITPVCQGQPGDFVKISGVPLGVEVRCDPCSEVMAKGTIRSAIGAAIIAKNVKDLKSLGSSSKKLKNMADKADELAKVSSHGVETAQDLKYIQKANKLLTNTLETFKKTDRHLLRIPLPSKIKNVANRAVISVKKNLLRQSDILEVQNKINEIYRIKNQINRLQAAGKSGDEIASLYRKWSVLSDEAFELLEKRNALEKTGNFIRNAAYLSCITGSLTSKAHESDLLPEHAKRVIQDFRNEASDIISDRLPEYTSGASKSIPPESLPCAAYVISSGSKGFSSLQVGFGGVITSTALNLFGGRSLGEGINILTSFSMKCGLPPAEDRLAICVSKKTCEGEGPCSACDVIQCKAKVKCISRPMSPVIKAEYGSDNIIRISGGINEF